MGYFCYFSALSLPPCLRVSCLAVVVETPSVGLTTGGHGSPGLSCLAVVVGNLSDGLINGGHGSRGLSCPG